MSEPGGNQDGPVGDEPEELESAGPWRNVPQPTTEELVTPAAQVADTPQIPMLVKVGGLALVAVLLLMAAWLGLTLGGNGGTGEPDPTPSPSIDETLWDLEAPTTLGGFVVGDVKSTPLGTSSNREIVTAKYSDGSEKLLLIMSRPEDNASTYLADAGIDGTEPVGEAVCGTSVDNAKPVCVRVIDNTAIGVAGLSGQKFTELAALIDSFYSQLR